MDLLTFIQIPCHHVLANEIALNLKYRIGLKHFFNINLGIGIIIKKLLFLFVFLTYLPMFLLKFQSGEIVGCGIKFCIQRVPLRHTFDGPRYPKNKKYLKKRDDDVIITFFQVFLVFGVAGPVKRIPSGYSLDAEFNSTFNELSRSKFDFKNREICQKYKQKSFFFFSSSKINKYYFIILTIILLIFLGGLF